MHKSNYADFRKLSKLSTPQSNDENNGWMVEKDKFALFVFVCSLKSKQSNWNEVQVYSNDQNHSTNQAGSPIKWVEMCDESLQWQQFCGNVQETVTHPLTYWFVHAIHAKVKKKFCAQSPMNRHFSRWVELVMEQIQCCIRTTYFVVYNHKQSIFNKQIAYTQKPIKEK